MLGGPPLADAFVTRFAPSPTGYLHIGHAYAALIAFNAAKSANGRFILRIEDIDQSRCRPEFEAAMLEDLAWIGVEWEEPVRRQSDHFADYKSALERLREKCVVYRCFKTRKEILDDIARAPHLSADGPEGPVYIGAPLPAEEEQSLLAAGTPFAWRLSIKAAKQMLGDAYDRLSFHLESKSGIEEICATPDIFGDIVIARKDAQTSYHLASVYDDGLQRVTHVIRGDDLAVAAHIHRLIQALLDIPSPVYRHHRLILNEDGKKFSKRDQSVTLRALRADGATPAEILRIIGLQ